MKPSVTIVFLLLFVVVGVAFYYLVPSEEVVEKPDEVQESMTLLDLKEDDQVKLIQIQNLVDKESITLKQENDKWMIKFPTVAAADGMMAKGLVSALTISRKARRLDREGDWDEYGLDKPDFKIGIETERGTERRYLLLGDKAPIGNFIFAKWENEEEYFLLDENLKKAFNRSVYSLRLKQIFTIAMKDIVKIRFRTTNEEYELSRHDGQWFWMEPIPILGEVVANEHMEEILSKMRDLYIKDFLDDETRDARELGFKLISPSIKVWSAEAEKPEVVTVGGRVEGRDALYGKLDGQKSYFTIAKSNIESLLRAVEALAKKFSNHEITAGNVLS